MLVMSREQLERIAEHARSGYPHECCGFLLGSWRDGRKFVHEIQPMANASADSPHNRYLIAPDAFVRAQRAAAARRLDVVGFYHSHPDLGAQPSEFDRRHAWPGYSYAIVSVCGGVPRETRSWVLREDRAGFREEEIEEEIPVARGGAERARSAALAGAASPALSPAERRRYLRQLLLPEVGLEGQLKLKAARVLLVGAGGLGSPLALYLAAAGVGTLGIAEPDVVDESNLQRQILFGTGDVGRPKLERARERLREANPHVRVEPFAVRLAADNALGIVRGFDLVCDGADNFPTRYLVNDACVQAGKRNVFGAVFRFEGQVSVLSAPGGPCYRCLHPAPPPAELAPACAEGGVLGVLPGIVGLLQATEVLKLILGKGEPLVGRLLVFDALAMRFRELRVARDPGCPACGEGAAERGWTDGAAPAMPAGELRRRLEAGDDLFLLHVCAPQDGAPANLPAHASVPLDSLVHRLGEFDPAREIVVCCRLGERSAVAVRILREAGFSRVWSLAGGFEAWAAEVGPAGPRR